MSNVIDNRVVEMRFDNGQFEKGVQQSLGTLDKLKQALNFSNIGDVGSKLNFGAVNDAIGSAGEKFNAFEQIAIGALRRIGEQGIDWLQGKIKSLSFDQINAGWEKYGEMTTNVATIMAATGDDIDTVSAQMEKLLYFTDETSYNFTDMANNIGKFTANGIGLTEATSAMEGIATWAAKSGQNAGTASRVMYNLAQAIGMGALKLQDWKSVELANMGTKEFKEQAIQAGLACGTLTKGIDGIAKTAKGTSVDISNFRETLAEGWLDSNTLMETLNGYGKAAELISDIHDATGLYASDMMDLVDKQRQGKLSTEAMADALGISTEELEGNKEFADALAASIEKLASDEYKFSLEAYKAGQEARTLKDAIDATKDAVSSGWMKTFELIFGNYEKAKGLWTDVAEGLYDIFTNGTQARNALLKDWGTNNWDKLKSKISSAGVSVTEFEDKVSKYLGRDGTNVDALIDKYGSLSSAIAKGAVSSRELASAVKASISEIISGAGGLESAEDKLKEIQQVVRDVWSGSLGNGEDRKNALESMGYDYEQIQKLVEKGAEYELQLTDLTDQELKAIGLGDEQIEQLRAIQADYESLLNLAGESGQDMLAEGIVNGLTAINEMLTMVKKTWKEFFGSITAEGLINVTRGFRDLTESLKLYNEETGELTETGEKVQSVLNKLFAAAKNVWTIFSQVGRIIGDFARALSPAADAAKRLAGSLLELFTSVTGRLGDYLKTVDLTEEFGNVAQFAADAINWLADKVDAFRKKFDNWKPGESFGLLGDILTSVRQKVSDFFKTTEDGVTPFQKLVNMFDTLGEKAKGLKGILQPVKDFLSGFWDGLKNALDLNGVTNVFEGIARIFSNIYKSLKTILSNFSLGDALKVAAGYIGVQALRLGTVIPTLGKNVSKLIKTVKESLESFNENGIFGTLFGELDKGGILGKLFPGGENSTIKKIQAVSKSLLELGAALLMIAASLAILAAIKPENLTKAFIALTTTLITVASVLVGFTKILKTLKINPAELIAVAAAIAIVSAALVVLAAALAAFALVAKMDTMWEGFIAMAASLTVVAAALAALAKNCNPVALVAVAAAILVVSAALVVLAAALGAFALVAMMKTMWEGFIAMAASLTVVSVALAALANNCDPVGLIAAAAAILVVSAALVVMAAALAAFTLIASQGEAAIAGLIMLIATLAVVAVALAVLGDIGPVVLLGAAALTAGAIAMVALAAGLAAAAVAIAALGVAIAAAITAVGLSVGIAVAAVATGISVAVIAIAAAVTAVVAAVAASFAMLATALGVGISKLVGGIASAATAIATAIGTIVSVLAQGLAEGVAAIAEGLAAVISAIATGIGGAIEGLATGIGGAIAGLGQGIGASIAAVGAGIGTAFEAVGSGIAAGISAISSSIGSFGASISSIGQGIENFGTSVKSLTFIDLVSVGKGLVEIAHGLKELNKNQFKGDASQVQAYANALKSLSQVSSEINSIGATLKSTMATLGTELSQNLANGIQNGIGAIQSSVTTIGNSLTTSFSRCVAEATRSGQQVGMNFAMGISAGIGSAAAAAQSLAWSAVNAAQSATGSFQTIGYNFVAGLTNGVYSGSGMLSGAVRSVVNQAVQAARAEAQVHSPSRVFAKIGGYLSLGMAKGVTDEAGAVITATEDMVNSAIDGVANAMTHIYDAINSDFEMDPVITPVLDLSNVETSSKKLSSMFSDNAYTVGAAADISSNYSATQQAAIEQQNRGVTASIDPTLMAALLSNANSGSTDVNVNFNGDLAQLAAILHPAITVETTRLGKSLINA